MYRIRVMPVGRIICRHFADFSQRQSKSLSANLQCLALSIDRFVCDVYSFIRIYLAHFGRFLRFFALFAFLLTRLVHHVFHVLLIK